MKSDQGNIHQRVSELTQAMKAMKNDDYVGKYCNFHMKSTYLSHFHHPKSEHFFIFKCSWWSQARALLHLTFSFSALLVNVLKSSFFPNSNGHWSPWSYWYHSQYMPVCAGTIQYVLVRAGTCQYMLVCAGTCHQLQYVLKFPFHLHVCWLKATVKENNLQKYPF